MEEHEFNELAEILFGLAGNFGDTIDEYTIKLWLRCFETEKITVDQIRKAAIQIMQNAEFPKMPTYAQFRKYIFGSPADKAQQQADLVIEFLRTNGRMATPIFSDPITGHLMRTRWPYRTWAAEVKESELVWWRKEFIEAYKSYAKNPDTVPANRQLEAGQQVKKLAEGIGK